MIVAKRSVLKAAFEELMMDLNRLEYIKNVNDDRDWAYKDYPVGAYFQLNFKRGEGVENHALNLPKGSLILCRVISF
jgi:hypothetical protein